MLKINSQSVVPISELFGKAISLLYILLLTRVVSVSDMGVYSYCISLIMISSVFMDGGLTNKAYILSLKQELGEINNYFNLRIVLCIVTIFILFVYEKLTSSYSFEVLVLASNITLVSTFSFYKMLYRGAGLIRHDIFLILVDPLTKLLSVLVAFAVLMNNKQIEFIDLSYVLISLLVFSLLENIYFFKKIGGYFSLSLDLIKFKTLVLSMKSSYLYTLYYFSFILFQRVDVFFIKKYIDINNVAVFFSAYNIYSALIMFYVSSITSSYPKEPIDSFLKILLKYKKLFLLSLINIICVFSLSDNFYSLVYPDQYYDGSNILMIISLSLPFMVVNNLYIVFFNVKDKTIYNFVAVSFIVMAKVLFYFCFKITDLHTFAINYAVFEIFLTAVFTIFYFISMRQFNSSRVNEVV